MPEKLLIALYRPKIHVVKLKSFSGPGTRQKGLKGNTITFPHDIIAIAKKLPAHPDVLIDHLKVVFIGNTRPTQEQMRNLFTVRRTVVCNALQWLHAFNTLYRDVTLDFSVDLPMDSVPNQIMDLLHEHDDPDNEDAIADSTYTPQTDLDDVPAESVVLHPSGIIDIEGSSVTK